MLRLVANNHQSMKCDKCNLWIYIKCNKINKQTYNYLQTDTCHWYCMSCTKEFLPSFSDTSDEGLMQTTNSKQIKFTHVDNIPKLVKENFVQKITSETNTSKYFNVSDLHSVTYDKKNDHYSFILMNWKPFYPIERLTHSLQTLYYQDLPMNICPQNQPMEVLYFTLKMI